ncbi:PTS sugar transporter subunit IIC [Vagococcus intermedius]|uniref:Permease IIC component n=1 Tax=Vagococcus intermedius TaxID=2991418 RepID=A0AAF0CTD0_9ENTE|nr:PTS sugar transporter subunit IIC [Vagococcus intermedius]WEG72593.1 PTS sugar transporter subunit IIC [Vagococcus intermedius]WEG74679.1 PTS sugar transporter subunit IIC [Vagococcus intermedius]
MQGLMNWLEKYIIPVATKIGNQKHLIALRDAFIGTMPATMAGSIAVLLNAFLRDFPTNWGWTGVVKAMEPIVAVNGFIYTGSLAIVAVIFSISLGYNLAKAYHVDPLAGAVVSIAAFIMGLTQTAETSLTLSQKLPANVISLIEEAGGTVTDGTTIGAKAWGFFNFGTHMGGSGLFTAIIFGFISVIIFSKLMKANITIKMPDSVPPAVSKAFAAIIPACVALYTAGIINYGFATLTGMPMIDWITDTIQQPLLHLSQGFGSVVLVVFLIHLLWFFGIHGDNVMAPVLSTIWGNAMNQNMNAFQSGAEIPYKWVSGTFNAFVWPGGSGATLMLVAAILVFSKRADQLTVAKLSLAPGLFNINEPVMFGMPIVLNPLYMIPVILVPCVTAGITYFATMTDLVKPVVVSVIWVMPPIINGFLATGGDWHSIILSIVNLFVGFLLWTPFVLAANKMNLEENN